MLFLQGLSNLRMAESKSAALPLGYAPRLWICRQPAVRQGNIAAPPLSINVIRRFGPSDLRFLRSHRQGMRLQPKGAGRSNWVHSNFCPPIGFIAAVMDFPVMTSTQWHGELIADLASECWMLRVSQMMGI